MLSTPAILLVTLLLIAGLLAASMDPGPQTKAECEAELRLALLREPFRLPSCARAGVYEALPARRGASDRCEISRDAARAYVLRCRRAGSP